MTPKRILHIIPTLDRSGAEKQLTLLAPGLARDEFDVHVAALTRGGPLAAELDRAGIETTVIGKTWKLDPRAYWRLRRHVARLAPDLIHAWLFAANAYGRTAGLDRGVKHLVAAERCVDRWKGWTELAIDRYLARRTDRIVAVSGGVRDFYVEKGLPAEKFVVISNGVPPSEEGKGVGHLLCEAPGGLSRQKVPDPFSPAREQLLAELELPPDARLAGLIGRLWPQKRVKDAIWAADLLKRIRSDLHLLVIGDGPLRRRLEIFRDQVRIRDRVHFLGHRNDVPRILPHLDLLWSTSAYEGQSNAIMEAMAAGVPVIATDIPGTQELVVDGRTGYLVPVGKPSRAAVARYSERLLNDRELALRFSQAARQRMRDEFSVEKMVARYAELYRELLG